MNLAMSVYNQYTLVAVDQVLINWEGGDRRSSGVKISGLTVYLLASCVPFLNFFSASITAIGL